MAGSSYSQMRLLSARARALKSRAASPLPYLFFFTDPQRTPDPTKIARRLPPGAVIVYRHFGTANRVKQARALLSIARHRRLVLLIGADAALAARIGADGVHLPERDYRKARSIRRQHPRWLVTSAAHTLRALRTDAHLAVLSPLLPSRSASAGKPLGMRKGGAMARRARVPVIALGGVDARTHLRASFAGIAAVDAFLKA